MNPNDENVPTTEDRKVPLWIKVMWFFGIIWILSYIISGLQHTPATW